MMSTVHRAGVGHPARHVSPPRGGDAVRPACASPEDAALVARLLGRDEAAFTGLVEQYHGRLVRDKRFVPFSALTDRPGRDEPAVSPSRFTSSGTWSAPPERWDEDTPEQLLLRHETRALIDRTIAELPAGQRTVVTLRDVEGLDAADVCDILEISETNQRVQLHRARARIRTAVEGHLHGQPRHG